MTAIYGSSTVKRVRRTNAELAELDEAIRAVVEADFPVSLRGVYYRCVSIGAVDKTEAAYRAVGRRLLELRRHGAIPYDRITDGTRWVVRPPSYNDIKDALTDTANLYRRNLWRSQPVEVHIFTEKDAITGVIERVTEEWNVPLGVLRGYCSETFAYSMAQAIVASGKKTYVYQLGDHDPSGIGAWQDFQRKITGFIPDAEVSFQRLAVTPKQIEIYSLPTRPTKTTDTRARNFTGGSVEVDAIPAPTLRDIVRDAITQHVNYKLLKQIEAVEESERSLLHELAGLGVVIVTRNRASAKKAGSAFETLIAGYLAEHVDNRVERRTRNGSKDRGDISGLRHMGRVVVECKDLGGRVVLMSLADLVALLTGERPEVGDQ